MSVSGSEGYSVSKSLYGFVAGRAPVTAEEVATEYLGRPDLNGAAREQVQALISGDPRFGWDERGRLRTQDLLAAGLFEAPYVVFDVETTGSSSEKGGITEIGAVKIEAGQFSDTYSTLVNPGIHIEPFVARLTGITDELVADAPTPEEMVPEFERFVEGAVLVAHNAGFDSAFVGAARGGEKLPNPVLDTLKLARLLIPGLRRYRLSSLAQHLQVKENPNHRALSDAAATAEIFVKLLNLLQNAGVHSVRQALELRGRGKKIQPQKQHLAEGLPNAPGVYYFLDKTGRALYVGKAKDLKRRVKTYFSGGDGRRKIGRLVREVARVRVRKTRTELQALVLEAREIRRLMPPFNTVGREPEAKWYLRLDLRREYPVPERVSAEATGEDDEQILLGPYRSAGTLDTCVEALGRVFPLRRCEAGMEGPCIYGQMGRCAPCMGMSGEEYRAVLDELVRLLRGEGGEEHLQTLMEERDRLARDLHFEAAARLRDLISGIERARLARSVVGSDRVQAAVCPSTEPDVVEVFALARGRLIAHRGFDADDEAGLERFAARILGTPALGRMEREVTDEARIVAAYLRKNYPAVEVLPLHSPQELPVAARRVAAGAESIV